MQRKYRPLLIRGRGLRKVMFWEIFIDLDCQDRNCPIGYIFRDTIVWACLGETWKLRTEDDVFLYQYIYNISLAIQAQASASASAW